jgi:hypothetical protein
VRDAAERGLELDLHVVVEHGLDLYIRALPRSA